MSTTSHNNTPWEFTSFSLTTITIMPTFSLLSSNPLFSTIVTLYMLILLYFPHFFLKLIFSPLFISTFILLLSLLRFGASQQFKPPGRAAPGPSFEPEPGPRPEHKTVSLDQEQSNLVETQLSAAPGPEPGPKKNDEGIEETDSHPEEEDEGAEEHWGWSSTEPEPELKSEAHLEPFGWAQNHSPGPKSYLEWEFGPRTKYDEGMKENETHQEKQVADEQPGLVSGRPEIGSEAEQELYYCGKGFPEWEFGAPLEVIYEAYEGEEEGEESQNDAFHEENYNNMAKLMLDKYPSLSKYYPESDSESCSSWSLSYDDQEEREELIEIALDYHRGSKKEVKKFVKEVDIDDEEEEDNLIEIDISPTK